MVSNAFAVGFDFGGAVYLIKVVTSSVSSVSTLAGVCATMLDSHSWLIALIVSRTGMLRRALGSADLSHSFTGETFAYLEGEGLGFGSGNGRLSGFPFPET